MAGALGTLEVDVRVDGGSSAGILVMDEGALVAVLVNIAAGDLEEAGQGGWFLEAGFGPCGVLKTVSPGVFGSVGEALQWIEGQLAEHP